MAIGDQSSAVVVSHEPVMPTRRDVLLPEATGAPAKLCLLITMQMFEVQPDQPSDTKPRENVGRPSKYNSDLFFSAHSYVAPHSRYDDVIQSAL